MLISTEKEVIVWVIPEDHGNAFKTKAEWLLFFSFSFFFLKNCCVHCPARSSETSNESHHKPYIKITTTAFCLRRDLETTHLSAQQTRNRGKKIYCQTLFNVLNTWSSLSSDFKRPSGEDIFEAVRKVTEWH